MDEQRKILDKFRAKGWAGIGLDNCLTISITLATPEEAQQLYNQLYPTQNHHNGVIGSARRVVRWLRTKNHQPTRPR